MNLFISMVVYCLLMTVFNSSAVSALPVSTEDDDTKTKIVEGDKETHVMDEQPIHRYDGGRADDDFKFRHLFPTHFGEFFEIFAFVMELKWHYELEEAIAEAGERIDQHFSSSHGADGTQHKDDNFLVDFGKHYFVNNKTPL